MIFDFFKNNNDDRDAYKSIAKNAKEYGELYLQLFKLNAVGALSKFVSYLIVIVILEKIENHILFFRRVGFFFDNDFLILLEV